MSSADLTCQELVEMVTDYLEGRLPRSDKLRFEEHLLVCEGCTVYIEQMRQTIRMTGALRTEDVPAEVEEEFLRAFRGWKTS